MVRSTRLPAALAELMEPTRVYQAIPDGMSLRDALHVIVKNSDAGLYNTRHWLQLQEWIKEARKLAVIQPIL